MRTALGPRRGGRERLGRHAAEVELAAAHAIGFDENDARAIAAGGLGGREAGGTGADDADVGGEQARHRLGQDAPGPAKTGAAPASRRRQKTMAARAQGNPLSVTVQARRVALTSKAEFPISPRQSEPRPCGPAATPSVKQRQRGTAPGVV